jgi:ribosomal protein S18 acetylase RimI-like enzyme
MHMRAIRSDDVAFLELMLYEAAFWRPGRRPTLAEALAVPEFARYVHGWGRPGDGGVVAVEAGWRVGAAWYRLFAEDDHGYGFVGETVPELSLAVVAERRGQGIGRALLDAALVHASADGFRAISLSVEPDNPARRLYERAGFVRVGVVGGAWTMRTDLRGSTP